MLYLVFTVKQTQILAKMSHVRQLDEILEAVTSQQPVERTMDHLLWRLNVSNLVTLIRLCP